jgi:uncharacterized membrane protein YjjP (DUF1212 family)
MREPDPAPRPTPPPPEAEQREITRLCVQTGLVLMQHGAESALIESLMRRLGLALGVDQVEAGVFANSLVLSTLAGGRSMTNVRRVEDRGIHMHRVTEVQRAVLQVEEGTLDRAGYQARLEGIPPLQYPRWLVSVAIGLSCAAFARLAGADGPSCAVVVGASGLAMALRLSIARLHFSPFVNFFVSAFAATSLASVSEAFGWGATHNVARASCVLFLVPGFPLINGVSDMVKGYMSTGIARLANATLLASAAAMGILLSMTLWNLWGLP